MELTNQKGIDFELSKINFQTETAKSIKIKPTKTSMFKGKILYAHFYMTNEDVSFMPVGFTLHLSKKIKTIEEESKVVNEFVDVFNKMDVGTGLTCEIKKKDTKDIQYNVSYYNLTDEGNRNLWSFINNELRYLKD